MENRYEIDTILLAGTVTMLLLAFGLLILAIYYQNYFAKMRRDEAAMLLKNSLESEKKERQRIAADLHDGVQGNLHAIRNLISVLQKPEANYYKRLQMWTHIQDTVEDASSTIKQISYNLMPPLLEDAGIAMALREYVGRLRESTALELIVKNSEVIRLENRTSEYHLFRVIQELTNNMIQYGNISTCEFLVSRNQVGSMVIEIINDGIFYNYNQSKDLSTGNGHHNMEMRLNAIGAQLEQRNVQHGNHLVITVNTPKT